MMDGLIERFPMPLDTSGVAGRITGIIAARHERAVAEEDAATAARYDVSLDTIYFATLLLMVVNGTGATRDRREVLAALDTAGEVIGALRREIEGSVP